MVTLTATPAAPLTYEVCVAELETQRILNDKNANDAEISVGEC